MSQEPIIESKEYPKLAEIFAKTVDEAIRQLEDSPGKELILLNQEEFTRSRFKRIINHERFVDVVQNDRPEVIADGAKKYAYISVMTFIEDVDAMRKKTPPDEEGFLYGKGSLYTALFLFRQVWTHEKTLAVTEQLFPAVDWKKAVEKFGYMQLAARHYLCMLENETSRNPMQTEKPQKKAEEN